MQVNSHKRLKRAGHGKTLRVRDQKKHATSEKCTNFSRPLHGFTLVELVVVIMILGILAVIAVPRFLGTSHQAVDNGLRQSLGVIRTAIDTYAAANAGKLPGADGQQQTFKDDLSNYLRGTDFPKCPVGAAKNDQVRMMAGTGAIGPGIGATEATHSWVYQFETGSFYVNSNAVSGDVAITYDQF